MSTGDMVVRVQLFLLSIFLAVTLVTNSFVSVTQDGGYKGVTVAVSSELNQTEVEVLLPKIEELFLQGSQFLQTATRNGTYFREINILLPKHLKNVTLPGDKVSIANRKYFSSPDIFIEKNDHIFGERPFTIQNSGCGERGLYIKIPAQFFNAPGEGISEAHVENKVKTFVHEWSHFRYGVFDERGFYGDELYPLNYSVPGEGTEPTLQFTSCTNKKVPFVLRNSSGVKCDTLSKDCVPFIEQGEDILSSLMYDPSLPKVNDFCDGETFNHNRDAPTKQNSLCREQSTWSVVSTNEDFKNKRSTGSARASFRMPSFNYYSDQDPNIVFIVEATDYMAIDSKMDQLRNAFSYFVLYDLPDNSSVSMMSMKSPDSPKSKPQTFHLVSNIVRERLCDSFPEAYGAENICVHCDIYQTLKVLQSSATPEGISGTVIVTTSVDVPENTVANLTQTLKQYDVKLYVIFFPRQQKAPLLEQLAEISGGRLLAISPKLGNVSSYSPLTSLYEAFRTIFQEMSWNYKSDALVGQQIFANGDVTEEVFSFAIDEPIRSFRLILTVPYSASSIPVVKDEVVLKYQDVEYRAWNSSFWLKSKIPAYVFNIKNPQAGIWTIRFKKKSRTSTYIAVIVRASQDTHVAITMRSWFKPLYGNDKPPGIIYAEILKGGLPISHANVTAVIIHPKTNRITRLALLDSGEGDPDITRYDGIYSRYFTDFLSEGYYTLAVLVNNTPKNQLEQLTTDTGTLVPGQNVFCCGSVFPVYNNISDEFTREHVYGTFYVDRNRSTDYFPPRCIVDLRVINVQWMENGIKHFTLQWTAPGEDYDYGKADRYQIKVFKSRDDALYNFASSAVLSIDEWNTHGPFLHPESSGTTQTTTIELRGIPTGVYFLAMITIDHTGNKGDASNVVKVFHHEPTTEFTPTPTNTVLDLLFTTLISTTQVDNLQTANLGVIISVTCGLLFSMIVIAIVLFVLLTRHRRLKQKDATSSKLNLDTNKGASNDTLCQSANPDGTNISVISPVGSWPAATLLTHYESVRDYKNGVRSSKRERDTSDTISQASTLYASINRNPEKDSVLYYPMDYPDPLSYRDMDNYPFNPAYTSSLRRLQGQQNLSQRLNTDV